MEPKIKLQISFHEKTVAKWAHQLPKITYSARCFLAMRRFQLSKMQNPAKHQPYTGPAVISLSNEDSCLTVN